MAFRQIPVVTLLLVVSIAASACTPELSGDATRDTRPHKNLNVRRKSAKKTPRASKTNDASKKRATPPKGGALLTCLPAGQGGKYVRKDKPWLTAEIPCCAGLTEGANGNGTYTCRTGGNDVCDPGETYMTSGGDCKCGNEAMDQGEGCDLGARVNGTGKGCTAGCMIEDGWSCTGGGPAQTCVKTCGNGTIDRYQYTSLRERCDDGNTRNGDGCSSLCQPEDVL